MVNIIRKRATATINIQDYDVIIDVLPMVGLLDSSSKLYSQAHFFNKAKRLPGEIVTFEENGIIYVGLVCALTEASDSTDFIVTTRDGKRYGDTYLRRIHYLSQCLDRLVEYLKEIGKPQAKILSPLLLSAFFKSARFKTMSNLDYFIAHIESVLNKYPLRIDAHSAMERRKKKSFYQTINNTSN